MSNYYEILGAKTNASKEEIKKLFRSKIKELHPDIKPATNTGSDEVNQLLKAYQILCDDKLREQYDIHYNLRIKDQFDYREFLKNQKSDLFVQSKLIFFDLLHERPLEAINLYEELNQLHPNFLYKYLEKEDFMDCVFLLAEEFEVMKNLEQSYILYKAVLDLELEKPYFHHFVEEIKDRIRNIICNKMSGKTDIHKNLIYISEMVKSEILDKEKSFYYKKMAELYLKIKDIESAKQCLEEAELSGGPQGGVKKLFKKMQLVAASVNERAATAVET